MNSYKIWLCMILLSPLQASCSSTSSYDISSISTSSSDLESLERQNASSFQGSQNQSLQVADRSSENPLRLISSTLAARVNSSNITSSGSQEFHTLERKLSDFNRRVMAEQNEIMEELEHLGDKIVSQHSENKEKLKKLNQQLLEYKKAFPLGGLSVSILGNTPDEPLLGSLFVAQRRLYDTSRIITRYNLFRDQIADDLHQDKKDESLESLSSSEKKSGNHNSFDQGLSRPSTAKRVSFFDLDEMNGEKHAMPLLQLTGRLVDTNLYEDKEHHSNNSSVKNRSNNNDDDDGY